MVYKQYTISGTSYDIIEESLGQFPQSYEILEVLVGQFPQSSTFADFPSQ